MIFINERVDLSIHPVELAYNLVFLSKRGLYKYKLGGTG